jgi:hypothetical protein
VNVNHAYWNWIFSPRGMLCLRFDLVSLLFIDLRGRCYD